MKALAVGATVLSTALVGVATWLVFPWLGVELRLLYCLLFGSLISPTEPIAVMGLLKTAGASEGLGLVIAGESFFNDGVVVFSLLLGVVVSGVVPTASDSLLLLLREAGGGVMFGAVLGYVAFRLL